MSEEKTKKKIKSKITSFHAYRDELENPEMDQFLRESIMKEADELEARLNSDPKLAGISASDDMFGMIVGKLKAQGYWEEDEADDKSADDMESAINENLKKREIEKESEEEKKIAAHERLCEEIDAAKPEEKIAGISQKTSEVELAKLYEEQPGEILRLIERGKKAEQEEKERACRRAHRNKFVRCVAVAVAAFVLLFGVGFNTEASRGWILKMWDAAMEGFGFKAATDNVNDGVEARIKSEDELKALEKIREDTGVSIPDFIYLPKGMQFLGYELTNVDREAKIFYSYKEKIFSIEMIKLGYEGSSYYVLDSEAELVDKFAHSQGPEIEIWETNLEMETKAYVAEFEYNDCRYVLNGMIPLEEIKKILEIMIFL